MNESSDHDAQLVRNVCLGRLQDLGVGTIGRLPGSVVDAIR